MHLPSRGLRPSATTMRNTGVFLVPMRFMRILTGIGWLVYRGRGQPPCVLPPAVFQRRVSKDEGREYAGPTSLASPVLRAINGWAHLSFWRGRVVDCGGRGDASVHCARKFLG